MKNYQTLAIGLIAGAALALSTAAACAPDTEPDQGVGEASYAGTEWTSPEVPDWWEFTTGETLVCGPDAKPALDFRDDEIGWWAYCEPALVD